MSAYRPTAPEDVARVQVDLAAAAAGALPLADLDLTARDLTRVLPLLQQVVEGVAALLGTDKAALWVTDPVVRELYPVAWTGIPNEEISPRRIAFGEGAGGRSVADRKPVLVIDLDEPRSAAFRAGARRLGIRTVFSTPMLTITGEPMGTITTYHSAETEPGERERGLVELYARQAAEIVERARMHAEARQLAELERHRAGQLRALASAALALSAAETLDDVLRIVTESARDIIGTHQGVTSRLPHGWSDATTYVSLSETYAAWRDYAVVPEGRGVLEYVTRENAPLRLTGAELVAHPEWRGLRDAPDHPPLPDYLAAPLIGRSGANLGLIQLSHKHTDTPFTPEDEAILVQLAQMASSVIEAVEALEGERAARRDAELAATAQAALSMASALFAELLDPDQLSHELTRLVVPRLADLALLHLVDDDDVVTLRSTQSADPALREAAEAFFSRFPISTDSPYGAGYVIATGRPQLLPALDEEVVAGVTADPEERGQILKLVGSSGVCVPLTARGRTIGVLSVSRDQAYSDREVSYLVDLTRRAGLALDNASRYAFERGLADALQRSLLPRGMPTSALLTTASRYLPGARGTQIGGDWYDVIEVSEGRLMVVVGDVMGRGVQAAAVMGQLRATVRAYALEGHGPAALLARLDRVVQALDDVTFTTCVVGRLDPVSRNLCIASAGHLWPLLIGPDGSAEYLEIDPGLPLGVGGAEFVDQWYDLDPGTTVLLYTDGLVEGRDRPVEQGMDLLREACRAPVRSADELCDRVLQAMRTASESDDDTALLALLLDDGAGSSLPPLHLELGASPQSAAVARDALAELLGPDVGDVGAVAGLLVTELVANAVRYGGGDVHVRAGVRAGLLLVEVRDSSERMPTLVPDPRPDAEGGRGMLLVDRLADRWGAEALPTGKRVWFELSLDSA